MIINPTVDQSKLTTNKGQLPGTATNDSAAAGFVGEVVSSTVGMGASLTTATNTDFTSISLTAGDWLVWGELGVTFGTLLTSMVGWINTTSLTNPNTANGGAYLFTNLNNTSTTWFHVGMKKLSLSGTTTVYLSGSAGFTGGSGGYGCFLGGLRVR